MHEKTLELIKKFEQDHEIYLSATDALTYWVIYARITRVEKETSHPHHGKKFVSGPGQDGNVLVLRDPSSPTSTAWNPGDPWKRSTIL